MTVNIFKKLMVGAVVAGAFVAALLVGPGVAHADPMCPDGTNWDAGQGRCH